MGPATSHALALCYFLVVLIGFTIKIYLHKFVFVLFIIQCASGFVQILLAPERIWGSCSIWVGHIHCHLEGKAPVVTHLMHSRSNLLSSFVEGTKAKPQETQKTFLRFFQDLHQAYPVMGDKEVTGVGLYQGYMRETIAKCDFSATTLGHSCSWK